MSNISPNNPQMPESHPDAAPETNAEPSPRAEPSGLEDHLGYWLRVVSNRVSHAFKVKVEQRGVTVAEWVVLRALYERDGVKPSELASKLGLTRGAISKLVDRLAAKGLFGHLDHEQRASLRALLGSIVAHLHIQGAPVD
jgi:hypothetical protein